MNEDELRQEIIRQFDPKPEHVDSVVREAKRLDRSNRFERDFESEITVELVIAKLEEANRPIIAGWNWWMGCINSFELGYKQYQIR